jgi:hypothetical protein
MNSTAKLALQCSAAFAFVACIGVGIPHLLFGRTGGPFTKEATTEWGTITKISGYRNGKSSTYANVTTTKYHFHDMQISRFPGNNLLVGDRIAIFKQANDVRQETSYIRNDSMVRVSTCFDYMPCWKDSIMSNTPSR